MGQPVEFDGINRVLGPPSGSDSVKVLPMSIFTNGVCCVSCWQLTPDEIAEVNRTGRIFLSVFSGGTQAPVFIGSEQSVRDIIADYGVWKR
jgi:hypothetical protein